MENPKQEPHGEVIANNDNKDKQQTQPIAIHSLKAGMAALSDMNAMTIAH